MHLVAGREVTGRQSRRPRCRAQSGPPSPEAQASPSATWLTAVQLIR